MLSPVRSQFGPAFALTRVLSDAASGRRPSTVAAVTRQFSAKSSTGKENNKESVTSAATPPGDYKAVDLSYAAFECKPREGEKAKDPLVILHSLLGRKKNWKTVAKEINHLTRRKIVSVDARNHGDSPHTPDMSYSLIAKDMTHLFKQLYMDKIDFMGHSMGGRVGMILALTQPQLINKLICVDATPVDSVISVDRWKILGEAINLLKTMEPELRKEKGVCRTILADKIVRSLLPNQHDRSLFLSNLLVTKDKNHQQQHSSSGAAVAAAAVEPLWRINVDAFVANPHMTVSFPNFTDVAFEGKALFVAGDKSKFFKHEHEPEIRRLFPNARIVTIPDCGHWVHSERHKEFMEVVVPFLLEG